MSQALVPGLVNSNRDVLVPVDAGKDKRHRLNKYVAWLATSEQHWAVPNLVAYREYLLDVEQLSPESVSVHLSSVRSRYRDIMLDRNLFFSLIPPQQNFAERKALVDELLARIQSAIDPRLTHVKTRSIQDRPDSHYFRLSREQARELLSMPDTTTLAGRRDRALIATLLCTGIREGELCGLEVRDLKQALSGELALHVRHGKGRKERMIPYGGWKWCLPMIELWLRSAEIYSGSVFRGLRKGERVRKTALNERTVQKILAKYQIFVDGVPVVVQPHDCRRTYARWLFDSGVKVDAIRQNMGHQSIEMTFRYIGPSDVSDRLPPEDAEFVDPPAL